MEGNAARLRREHNQRAWSAWHTAMMGRAKKMPKLSELLIRDQPKAQTMAQMIATAKLWADVTKKKG